MHRGGGVFLTGSNCSGAKVLRQSSKGSPAPVHQGWNPAPSFFLHCLPGTKSPLTNRPAGGRGQVCQNNDNNHDFMRTAQLSAALPKGDFGLGGRTIQCFALLLDNVVNQSEADLDRQHSFSFKEATITSVNVDSQSEAGEIQAEPNVHIRKRSGLTKSRTIIGRRCEPIRDGPGRRGCAMTGTRCPDTRQCRPPPS